MTRERPGGPLPISVPGTREMYWQICSPRIQKNSFIWY